MNTREQLPNIGPAKYLTLHFEGYFACRIATDPDPTNEARGMSGYTMALSTEAKLDQIIRLQVDREYLERNNRPPMRQMGVYQELERGVYVRDVTFDGQSWPQGDSLLGARVYLRGRDRPFDGPTFESRNNITGSDDNLSFVVDPFDLQIGPDKVPEASKNDDYWQICARDILNPAQPEQKIWQILDPAIYGRRLTQSVEVDSPEVAEALNVFDLYGYFYDRRRFLQQQIEDLTGEIDRLEQICSASGETPSVEIRDLEQQIQDLKKEDPLRSPEQLKYLYQVQQEQFKSRLYQLEFWGDRVISKLGTQVNWSFKINDPLSYQIVNNETQQSNLCGGAIDMKQSWPVEFWFGGWDGDFLTGYMRGSLNVPFTPFCHED